MRLQDHICCGISDMEQDYRIWNSNQQYQLIQSQPYLSFLIQEYMNSYTYLLHFLSPLTEKKKLQECSCGMGECSGARSWIHGGLQFAEYHAHSDFSTLNCNLKYSMYVLQYLIRIYTTIQDHTSMLLKKLWHISTHLDGSFTLAHSDVPPTNAMRLNAPLSP